MKDFIRRIIQRPDRFTAFQALLIISLLSIGVKLAYISVLGGGLNAFPSEGTDAQFYDAAARTLLHSGVYGLSPDQPTVEMPPGQPAWLAVLYALSGGSLAFARIAHVLLLTVAAGLIYLTGRQLFSPAAGFWSGLLIAIDPAQAYLAGTFLSDPLFIVLMMSGILVVLYDRRREFQWRWLLIAGLCFGLAGLTRNQGWLFPLALLIGALITRGRLLPLRRAAIILLVTLAVIAPWTYRNYTLTGRFVFVSSEGGLTLWASNNPEVVYRPPMPMSLPIYAVPAGLSALEIDQYYRQEAIDWIVSHPIEFAINGGRKVIALYSFDPLSSRSDVAGLYALVGLIPYGLLIPFILLGVWYQRRNDQVGVIYWYILFTTLLAMLFYGDSRIRAPIQPYLYLLACVWLIEHIMPKRSHSVNDALAKGSSSA